MITFILTLTKNAFYEIKLNGSTQTSHSVRCYTTHYMITFILTLTKNAFIKII